MEPIGIKTASLHEFGQLKMFVS